MLSLFRRREETWIEQYFRPAFRHKELPW